MLDVVKYRRDKKDNKKTALFTYILHATMILIVKELNIQLYSSTKIHYQRKLLKNMLFSFKVLKLSVVVLFPT